MDNELKLSTIQADPSLSDFVDVFYMFENHSDKGIEIASLPDGKVDLIFIASDNEPFKTLLMDLDRQPFQGTFPAKTTVFAISFKLLALEYVLETSIAELQSQPKQLSDNYWDISICDLNDFEIFVNNISKKIKNILSTKKIDEKKRLLFEYIYLSNGEMPVKELSEKSFWTSRDINRYFNKYVGLSLKAYCNILRFKASLPQIKKGDFFPEQKFADQNHFIRNVKKYSGVTPKELNRNENDRFVLLLDFPKK